MVRQVVLAMGNIHNIRGEHMEALRKYKYSLEQRIKISGEDDPAVGWYPLSAPSDHVQLHVTRDGHVRAHVGFAMWNAARELGGEVEGDGRGRTKNNIANAFKGMYKLDEAIRWYTEALETVTAHFGADHPEVAHVHWNMALCYLTKGEVEAQKRKLGWHSRWPFTMFSAHPACPLPTPCCLPVSVPPARPAARRPRCLTAPLGSSVLDSCLAFPLSTITLFRPLAEAV